METTELAAQMQPGVFSMRRTAQPWLDLLELALLTEIPNSSHPPKTQWVFFFALGQLADWRPTEGSLQSSESWSDLRRAFGRLPIQWLGIPAGLDSVNQQTSLNLALSTTEPR